MGTSGEEGHSLPLDALRRVDAVSRRFDKAWRAGPPPRLEDFLGGAAGPEGEELFRQLLRVELEYRALQGTAPAVEEYLSRFPGHETLVRGEVERRAVRGENRPPPADTAGTGRLGIAESTMPSASGPGPEVIIPGYEVRRPLGRGGMGVVYEALQIKADRRPVALKVLRGGSEADPEELQRFRGEAGAAARLQHPNIAQIFEVGEYNGGPYFSMELCGAGSLDHYLRGGPVIPAEAAALVETLARAMHHAHQAGIIHRDLKPANILLASEGRESPETAATGAEGDRVSLSSLSPKVGDFGLARKLDTRGQTQTGAIIGTPCYMAPEQAAGRNKDLGPPADIYALGAILYECLTGRPPFRAATALDTVLQVISDEPVPPTQLNAKVLRDLETICLKCLHKEPSRRYATAEELANDLRRYQTGEPIAARPVGRRERLIKWARRNPAVASLLAAVLLIFAVGTVISSYFAVEAWKSEKNAREEQVKTARALEEVDGTLAEGFLRSIGQGKEKFDPVEMEDLWKLASLSSPRVGLRALRTGLEAPRTAERLALRADVVIQVVVGLDTERRQEVSRLLAERYRRSGNQRPVREACALLVAALQPDDEQLVKEAAGTLVEMLTAGVESYSLREVAGAVKDLASGMGQDQAEAATRWVVEKILSNPTDDSTHLWVLLRPGSGRSGHPLALGSCLQGALQALANRLSQEQVMATARSLFEETPGRLVSVRVLRPLVDRLGTEQVSAMTAKLLELLDESEKTQGGSMTTALAGAVQALAGRLEQTQAATAARRVLEVMEADQRLDGGVRASFLAGALQALAARLSSGQAEAAAGRVVKLLLKRNEFPLLKADGFTVLKSSSITVSPLETALRALALRLEEKQLSGVLDQVIELMDKATHPAHLWALARALQVLPPQRAKGAAAAANRVLRAMELRIDPVTLLALGKTLLVLTDGLPKEQAAKLRATAATRVATLVTGKGGAEVVSFGYPQGLGLEWESRAEVLQALAPWLKPEQAPAVADWVVKVMRESSDPHILSAFAEALSTLTGRLEKEQAAKLNAAASTRVAEVATQVLEGPKVLNPQGIERFSVDWQPLAGRLGKEQAAAAFTRLIQATSRTTNDRRVLALGIMDVGTTLMALAGRLDKEQANDAAQQVFEVMDKTTADRSQQALAAAVQALASRVEKEQASRLTTAAATWFVEVMRQQTPVSSGQDEQGDFQVLAIDLAPTLREFTSQLDRQALVEVLKAPACTGTAREVVLQELSRRAGRPFPTRWDFVEWARQHVPELDLRTPVRRPGG